ARLPERLPADHHAPDLACACTDLVELGIAQISSGRIIVDVAVAAEELNRVKRDLGGVLGGIGEGAGGAPPGGPPAVACLRPGVAIGFTRVNADIHVG